MRTYDPDEVSDRTVAFGDGVSVMKPMYQKLQGKPMNTFDKAEQARRAQAFSDEQKTLGFQAPVLPMPVPKVKAPKDMRNVVLEVGQKVAYAIISGNSPYIDIREVTKIENGKVFLNDSPRPLVYPNRLLIVKD